MTNMRTEATLRDLCDLVQYGYTASATSTPVGPKFLRITDIVPQLIEWGRVPFCEIDADLHAKFAVRDNDILVARTGATVGYAKRLRNPPDAVFASYLVRLRVKPGVDAGFIGAIVESAEYKRFIAANAGGAAQPNANAQVLTSFKLNLPPLPEQRRIASILSAYDDLIENNTRRIAILEEMARRIYEEWFVRFRFPGHENVRMVESELGLVPEGWSVKTLGAVADVQWGDTTVTKKAYTPNGQTAYSAAGPDGLLPYADYNRTGVVLSAIGNCGITWFASGQWSCIKNTIRFFASKEEVACDEFLFQATKDKAFWPVRGAAQPFISLGDARAQKLVVPDLESMKMFKAIVGPHLALCAQLKRVNVNLRTTHDLLLPKLISGELDVSAIPEPEALAA